MRHIRESFPWRYVLGGATLYLALQVLCIGVAPFSGSSEAREAQVVDVILREGTWALPLRNGVIPSKPPLYHWITALTSMAFGGVSEFSARLTSQLAATVCLVLVSLISFRVATSLRACHGSHHGERSALLSAGVLSLTYGFYQMGCQAMVDMTFTACLWSALASVVLGARVVDSRRGISLHPVGRALFWFFCFIGVLARGPLGLLLPIALAGIAAWCVLGSRRAIIEFCTPSIGWLAVGLPVWWYISAHEIGGEAFLARQIFFENIKRFSGGEFVNSEAWWFYIPSLLRTTFPWILVLLIMLWKNGVRSHSTVSYPNEHKLGRWVPLIVLCAGATLFSLSSGKRHSYMLPLIPLLAIQVGLELSAFLERAGAGERQGVVRLGRRLELTLAGGFMLVLVFLSVAVATGAVASPMFIEGFSASAEVMARMGAIVLGCALVVFVSVRRHPRALFCSVWFLMTVVMTTVVAVGAVAKAHFKGFDQMGTIWSATVGDGDEMAVFKHPFDEYFDPLLFYVRRPVRLIPLENAASECRARTVYAAKKGWLDAHEGTIPGSVVRIVVASERLRAARRDPDRDIVFFRCRASGGSSEQTEALREAMWPLPQALKRDIGFCKP